MHDNFCLFLNLHLLSTGFLYCQVAVRPPLRKEDRRGRQKVGCGYPPSFARSQKTGGGILGIMQKKKSSRYGCSFVILGLCTVNGIDTRMGERVWVTVDGD